MDTLWELYYGAQDAFDLVYPWIPASFKNSIQSVTDQSWVIVHTAFTNPADLKYLIPSIISTLTLLLSIYWTVSSIYYAARRGFRLAYFLLKYGSIVALALGGLGWGNPDAPADEVTFPSAVLSGVHTVMRYVNNASGPRPPRAPRPFAQPRKSRAQKAAQSGAGKPWEKFKSNDPPSSNTRSKASGSSSRRRRDADGRPESPFGDLDAAKVLSWINTLRGSSNSDEREESAIERTLKDLWEGNPDAWPDLSFFGARGEDSEDVEESDAGETHEEDHARASGTETR